MEKIQKIEQNSIVISNYSTAIKITDENITEAVEYTKKIKTLIKEIESEFEEPKSKTWQAHKSITAMENKYLDPLNKAEKILKQKLSEYNIEIQRKQQEELAKKYLEHQKQAEETKLLEEELKEKGLMNENESIQIKPVEIQRFETKSVTGLSFCDNWTYEIIDINLIPREYLILNEKLVSQYIKKEKSNAKIEGLRIYNAQDKVKIKI